MQENLVKISELIGQRIDPHFYRKEFVILTNSLKNSKILKLVDIIDISNETWNQTDFFNSTFPYIEISEIDTETGEIQNIKWCDIKEAPSRAKMIVRHNDIIVSTTRPNRGAISLIPPEYDGYIASTGFAVLRDTKTEEATKEYLYYFLHSTLSLKQMLQRASGGNYPAITLDELKKILIPLPSIEIQNKIVEIMKQAYDGKKQKEEEAQKLIDGIDDFVLSELGIILPAIKNKKAFTSTISNLFNSRFDTYYHQPKFGCLIEQLENNIDFINLLTTFNSDSLIKGYLPSEKEKNGDGKCLQIKNIQMDGTINTSGFQTANISIFKNAHKLNQDDIIIVITGATIGKVGLWNSDEEFYLGGDMVKFQANQNFNPHYIQAYLLSPLGQLQIQRNITGATNGHLSPNDIEKIKILIPKEGTQDKIANEYKNRMTEAKQLQQEAKEEFEKAKTQVEKIILGEENL